MRKQYDIASFRSFCFILLPILLQQVSMSIMNFLDCLLLSHYSLEAIKGFTVASACVGIFQLPLTRMAITSQVFVAQSEGAGCRQEIGPYVWQMIWLSVMSSFITIPISLWTPSFLLGVRPVESHAEKYFDILMLGNVLFPLAVALTTFFVGQRKFKIILWSTLFKHVCHFSFDAILIYGVKGIIPAFGLKGAAFAAIMAECIECLVLGSIFLSSSYRKQMNTGNWHFNFVRFWHCIKLGLPMCALALVIRVTWSGIVKIATNAGEEYLIVLAFGNSLVLLMTFIDQGIRQSVTIIFSQLVGSEQHAKIWKLVRSASLFIGFFMFVLSIPLIVFPERVIDFFFSESAKGSFSNEVVWILVMTCLSMWFFAFSSSVYYTVIGILTAAHDTLFICNVHLICSWVLIYLPFVLTIKYLQWPAWTFWMVMSAITFVRVFILMVRVFQQPWKSKKICIA